MHFIVSFVPKDTPYKNSLSIHLVFDVPYMPMHPGLHFV